MCICVSRQYHCRQQNLVEFKRLQSAQTHKIRHPSTYKYVAQTLESLQRIHGFILQLPNEVDQKVHNWHAGVLWAHSIAKAIGKNVSGTHHHGIAATELRELPQAHPLSNFLQLMLAHPQEWLLHKIDSATPDLNLSQHETNQKRSKIRAVCCAQGKTQKTSA